MSLPAVSQDGCAVEEENHRLMLKDFGLGVDFAGRLRRSGKRARFGVYRDGARNAWFASVPAEVGAETTESGNE